MSYLTDNPCLMQEALCVLVRKLGGSVTITRDDAPGPFNLMSKFDKDGLHLVLEEGTEAYKNAISSGSA